MHEIQENQNSDEMSERVVHIDDRRLDLIKARNLYPFDTTVLFRINKWGIYTENPPQWKLEGVAYLPGKQIVKAVSYPKGLTGSDCQTLYQQINGVTGEVEKVISSRTDSITLHLGKVKIPEFITIGNRVTMPRLEWTKICENHKCGNCGGFIQGLNHENETTILARQGLNQYKITCSSCLKKSIPDEEKRNGLFKSRIAPL